ncbi:MAG: GFA family protein [Pseudomonadota bacterium]
MGKISEASQLLATCSCGGCRVKLNKTPQQRFFCHCTICQKVYDKPFADATITLARNAEVLTPDTITYTRHKAPPVLDRGTCQECNDPVVGFLKMPALPKLAFMPVAVLPNLAALPAASRHIHYATRISDIRDDLPKADGELASFVALIPDIVRVIAKSG